MDEPPRARRALIEVILAGTGARGRAWGALLSRSTVAHVAAIAARDPTASEEDLALDAPRFATIAAALAAFPAARVAVALPPRAALDAALALANAGRVGLVEAPLHLAVARAALPAGAAAIGVAHGWVTLPGRAWMERALAARAAKRVTIEARGLPEEAGGDVDEVLVHALALALRLSPGARVAGARQEREARIDVTLATDDGPEIHLSARAKGHGLAVRAEGASFEIGWTWSAEDDRETLTSRVGAGRRASRDRAVATAAERALHQLVDPAAAQGDSLLHAARAARLAEDVARALGHRVAFGARSLQASARIARARPRDLLAQLGLEGDLPAAAPAPSFRVKAPPEPIELWAFRAGVKPVAFLTAHPADADRLAAFFAGAHVERRERRVEVGPQDAWIDRRDRGEERVELYIARDPADAMRAARLQAEGDPSASLRAIGALLGYPPCCVEAFAAQSDRSNNTRNRYATAARTREGAAWPWELNNLHTLLLPCYPCSYACGAARELAAGALAAMDAAHPGTRRAIGERLARPSLYFDHERQMVLHGVASGDTARFSGVSVPEGTPSDFAALAGAIGAGDELTLDDEALVVRAAGRVILRLHRTDPGLGFLAPFGEAPR